MLLEVGVGDGSNSGLILESRSVLPMSVEGSVCLTVSIT